MPTEPVSAPLWLAVDAEAAAPWLPSVGEQDAAWLAVYGDAAEHWRAPRGSPVMRDDRKPTVSEALPLTTTQTTRHEQPDRASTPPPQAHLGSAPAGAMVARVETSCPRTPP